MSMKNSSLIVTIVFVVIVVLLLGVNLTTMFQINEIKEKNSQLSAELDSIEDENDRLIYEINKFSEYVVIMDMLESGEITEEEARQRLNESLDEETIRRIAKEKLGLVDANEEHYIVS